MRLILLCILMTAACAHAFPQLEKGMSRAEVLRLAGPAEDKLELEVKRVEVWNYPQDELVFEQGKLVRWTGGVEPPSQAIDLTAAPSLARADKVVDKSEIAGSREERKASVLEDILRAVPSEDGGVKGGPAHGMGLPRLEIK